MKIKASNTQESARLIQAFEPPLEIEIPRQANVRQFMSGIRYYASRAKLLVSMADASTNSDNIIYVSDKCGVIPCGHKG